jgi:hypothetical protein
MITPSDILTRRIVSRFLRSQNSARGSPERRAYVWTSTVDQSHIPDDFILECSNGCTLTSREIERMLPASLNVTPGSCRIAPVPADAEANKTRFEAAARNGQRVTGTITVSIVASERRLDAFSVFDLDR